MNKKSPVLKMIPVIGSVVTVYWSQLCFNTVSGNPNRPDHQTATNYFLQDRKFTGSFWRVQEFSEDIQSSVYIFIYQFADLIFE